MQITIKKFIKDFEKIIANQQMNNAMKLAKGQCSDMEAYKRAVGQSEGMGIAVQCAKDMLNQLEEAIEEGGLPEMDKTE